MPGAQPRRDLLGGRDEDAQVRLALPRERRRQRDEDRVGLAELVVVGRRGDRARRRRAASAPRSGRPRCSSRRRSAARRGSRPRRRAARSCRRRRRCVRGAGRRSRRRRWRRRASSARDRSGEHLRDPLRGVAVAVQDGPIRAASTRDRDRLRERGRVVVDEHVRADGDRVDPLGRRPDGDARARRTSTPPSAGRPSRSRSRAPATRATRARGS